MDTNVIATTLKARKTPAKTVEATTRSMSTLNAKTSNTTQRHGTRTTTDVTDFGLVGHTTDVARENRVNLKIQVTKLPLLPETLKLAKNFQPNKLRANRAAFEPKVSDARDINKKLRTLLYNPQTSNSLLLLVPQQELTKLLGKLPAARLIGRAVNPTKTTIHLV